MTQTLLDKRRYDVLNAVALKKMTGATAVSEIVDLTIDEVRAEFAELAAEGLIVQIGETVLPTDASGPMLVESAAAHYGPIRTDPTVLQIADKFEDVNSRFLRAMSAWQQLEVGGRKLANDHSDSAYDAKVTSTIERLVSRLEGLLDALGERDGRFRTYIGRFQRSLAKVDSGDIAFVSDPTKDSVHNVWFEFHEDLLRTLGRARKE
jgi:hypothetical protein